jgi:hypothetical protein
MDRRDFIKKMGIAAGGAACLPLGLRLGPAFAAKGGKGPKGGAGTGGEPMPLSPLILDPFNQLLPVPQPLVPKTLAQLLSTAPDEFGIPNTRNTNPPGPLLQDSRGEVHQLWVDGVYRPSPVPGRELYGIAPPGIPSGPVFPCPTRFTTISNCR